MRLEELQICLVVSLLLCAFVRVNASSSVFSPSSSQQGGKILCGFLFCTFEQGENRCLYWFYHIDFSG